jgi:hypothetical protein
MGVPPTRAARLSGIERAVGETLTRRLYRPLRRSAGIGATAGLPLV